MIETASAYKTRDGKLFLTLEDAREHENRLRRTAKYDEISWLLGLNQHSTFEAKAVVYTLIKIWPVIKKTMED